MRSFGSDSPAHSRLRPGAALVALLLAALLAPATSQAVEYTPARKFGRGLAGMTLGFLEVPGNMVAVSRESGPAAGMTLGLAIGLGKLVVRELVGVYEFVSAPFAAPTGYVPILEPEFPWDYFESEPGTSYGYLSGPMRDLERVPGVVVTRGGGALNVRFPADLLFATSRATLAPEARTRLRDVAATLREHPETRVTVQGYTDSTGSPDTNLLLSEARASAVRAYLVELGVAPDRIGTAGYGDARPIASNQTAEGRRANRRVELELRAGGVALYR